MYLSNSNCEVLKRYLQQENIFEGRILCNTCIKRKFENCELLSREYLEEKKEVFKQVWKNILVDGKDGEQRLMVKYI